MKTVKSQSPRCKYLISNNGVIKISRQFVKPKPESVSQTKAKLIGLQVNQVVSTNLVRNSEHFDSHLPLD